MVGGPLIKEKGMLNRKIGASGPFPILVWFLVVAIGFAATSVPTTGLALTVDWTTTPSIVDSENGGNLTPRLSPGVEIKYVGESLQYALAARNSKGNKTYAVNDSYPGVYMKDGLDNDFSTASETFSGWFDLAGGH